MSTGTMRAGLMVAALGLVLAATACSSSHHASSTSSAPATTVTTTPPCLAAQPVEIFFRVDPSPAQIINVRGALADDARLKGVHFIDHAAAYANAKKLFHDDPDLLLDVKPGDLPESFRATTVAGTNPHEIASRYAQFPGVTSVNFPQSARLSGCPS